MSSISITFRTEPNRRDEIDRLAESLDRDRSWIINDALKNYIEMNRWQMEQIEAGKRDITEGRYKSLDAVRSRFRSKAANAAE